MKDWLQQILFLVIIAIYLKITVDLPVITNLINMLSDAFQSTVMKK